MMKRIRSIFMVALMGLFMTSFSQCSSSKDLQKKAPTELAQVYCQSWIAGIEGGGSGINIFIPVEDFSVGFDSVYFRGKGTDLEKLENEKMYVGRFLDTFNTKKRDMVFSSDPKEEYGNQMPETKQKIPFELKENECVISYKDKGKTKYFKVDNVVEKDRLAYPSAPPNKQ